MHRRAKITRRASRTSAGTRKSKAQLVKELDSLRAHLAKLERGRSSKEPRLYIQRLSALREINMAIASSLDLHTLLDILLEQIDHFLPYSAATVRLLNRTTGEFEPIACRNINVEEWKVGVGQGFIREMMKSRAPVISTDVQTDPRARHPHFFRKYGLASFMGVPLIAKGEILGILSFYTKEKHQFSQEEIRFLSTLASQAALAIHNSRLFEQVEKRTHEISALQAVTAMASQSLELDVMLRGVVKKITEIFEFDATRIFLLNPQMDEFRLSASFETKPDLWAEVQAFRRGEGIVGKVTETGNPMIFEDVLSDPRYKELSSIRRSQRVVEKVGFRFLAVFAIKSKIRTLGAIACVGKDARRLTTEDIQLITSMADHISIAVEYSRLFEETNARAKELSALYSISTVFNESFDFDFLLRDVMEKVLEMFEFDAARIYLYDEETKELRLMAHRGFPQDLNLPNSYKPGQGILGRVFERGEPILFEDIQTDPKFRRMVYEGIVQRAGYRGSFGIPIRVKDKMVGVINFVSKSVHRFSSNEVQLIHSIANHVGIAVENAKLFEEVKRKSQELEVLVRINRDIAALLDRETLLANIAEQARRLLKMDGANFRLIEGEYLNLIGSSRPEKMCFRQRFKIGESLAGKVIQENRVIALKNFLDDPTMVEDHREMLRKAGYRSYLGIPLQIGGRAIGVINLISREEREISPGEISLMTAFADQAGIAIENANLFAEVRDKAVELEKLNLDMQLANQAKSDFMTAMSHELRTPLNVIIGNADLIMDGIFGEITERQVVSLKKILRYSQFLLKLVTSVMTLTRMGAKKARLEVSTFDLGEVLGHMSAYAEQLNQDRGLEVRWNVEPDLPSMTTDALKLEEILQNLIGNAFKFTSRGSIEVRVRNLQTKERVEFGIADTGIGIEEGDLKQIFDEFYQLKEAHTGEYSGVGLGLSIVKNYLEIMNGEIQVESQQGKGSVFNFTLPYSI